ncbi:IS4 family transposase [Cupriavidus necator]|nr:MULTISPECIES: IS4 family transposase [Cupriavidus]
MGGQFHYLQGSYCAVGFLGRKSDGEPGAKTIWIGMQRTMDAALTIQALREERDFCIRKYLKGPQASGP